MRIETHRGNRILCGHFLHTSSIQAGQRWQGVSGPVVTVSQVDDNGVVTYTWTVDSPMRGMIKVHQKDAFSFQCRYCLILEDHQTLEDFEGK